MALLIYSIYHAGMAEELEGGSVVELRFVCDEMFKLLQGNIETVAM